MKKNYLVLLVIAFICFISLANSNTIQNKQFTEYLVDNTLDLQGDTLQMPVGQLIRFCQNAIIKNGVIIFQSGDYFVEATEEQEKCIVIGDNTEVIIDGNIRLLPNELGNYNILSLNGSNIVVKGSGTINGDKFEHLGKDGEWGHGIQVSGSGKTRIQDISIKNCWGDCIYVRNKNADVSIDGCTLDHGRRQGISITAASTVIVKNTLIKNVSGKAPQYAIDVEPNANDTIKKVIIENVQIKDCKGGIVASSRSKKSYVDNINLTNCNVEGHKLYPYYFTTLPSVSINNCKAGRGRFNIIYSKVKKLIQKNNIVVGFDSPVTHKK